MVQKRRILFAALVVAVLGGLTWLVLPASEPVFRGRSLSSWLDQLYDQTAALDSSGRRRSPNRIILPDEAPNAIRQIGTNSIPILLKMLHAKDGHFKQKLISFSYKHSIFPIHRRAAHEDQMIAIFAFSILGPAAKPAVPALIDSLQDSDSNLRNLAVLALSRIGPVVTRDALPALMKSLYDPDVSVQLNAAYALGDFGMDAKAAVPQLMELLSNRDFGVRYQATNALKQIDPKAAAQAGIK